MAITPITTKRRLRSYLVYDFEWVPGKFSEDGTMPIRLCGVYDGDRYRVYNSVESFLNGELTSKNRGKWFYAHAGGLADFQFVLQRLIEMKGFTIEASTSGSSLIIVHVTRGKNQWHFVDSYWLLRDKLRNIGKWVGLSKGNEDEDENFYLEASFEKLREYNEVDCIILYRAIEAFEEALWELGGMLKMTQASCAMELFRRRFLQRPIETSSFANHIARKAYLASRCEVFRKEVGNPCGHQGDERCDPSCFNAWYYDVNSSFPHAMTFPVPGDLTSHYHNRMPDNFDSPFLADVDVTVPDILIPPLPARLGSEGRLFFPTGSWRGWFTSVDIELLLSVGGRVNSVYESATFESRTDLAEYARTLYDLRARSEGFLNIACKYMLNSVYGKFGEGTQKSALMVNPESPGTPEEGWVMLFPGCFALTKQEDVPHEYVPIAAHITAIARRTLYLGMSESTDVHYCDTDGFSTSDYLGPGVERVLGEFKLEKMLRQGWFIHPKFYMLDGVEVKDGGYKELGDKGVRAKGFSKMTIERFNHLASGGELEVRRMARSKELLTRGELTPREMVYRKSLRGTAVPKRLFYPDGYSRPWTIDELSSVF